MLELLSKRDRSEEQQRISARIVETDQQPIAAFDPQIGQATRYSLHRILDRGVSPRFTRMKRIGGIADDDERNLVRMRRIAKDGGTFYVEPESKLALVIRIRGFV